MSPWTLLGWMICVIIALPFVGFILASMVIVLQGIPNWFKCRLLHYKTRNISPKEGQRWIQGKSVIFITKVTDDGRVCIKIENCSWSDDVQGWKDRVKNRKLFLVVKKK